METLVTGIPIIKPQKVAGNKSLVKRKSLVKTFQNLWKKHFKSQTFRKSLEKNISKNLGKNILKVTGEKKGHLKNKNLWSN